MNGLFDVYTHEININYLMDYLYPDGLIEVGCPQYRGKDGAFTCFIVKCPIKKIEPERMVTKQCMGGKFKVTWTKFILYKGLVDEL